MTKLAFKNVLVVFFIILMFPLISFAEETATGKLEGLMCLMHHKECSHAKLDPHLMFEHDFVLLLSNGEYYLLPNIPRDVKIQHIHDELKVTGTVNKKFNAMDVSELQVKKDGKYETVWSKKLLEEAYKNNQYK